MIDTDKYEGHTRGPWKINGYFSSWKIYWFDKELSDNWDSIRDFGEEYLYENFCHDVGVVASSEANVKLMADAPLLLQEVKRLNMVINMLRKNDLWVSTELWEESDKDDELLVSIHFLIDKALELRGDFND